MEELHFLRPWWLLAILPVVALAIAWTRRQAGSSHWESSIAPELLQVLLEKDRAGGVTRLGWVIAVALAIGAVGLAGPTWERLPQPVEQRSDAMIIVLDLSLSMYAQDVAPNRLVRARHKITDVLRKRQEGFTAMVAYAGDAHTVAPLTDDTRTIQNLLAALAPAMMPILGSNPRAGLEAAHALFENARVTQGQILLVTDGVDRIGDVTEFADARYPISILGVGTAAGGRIPLDFANQPGKVLTSQQGDPIIARLDDDRLSSIAGLTHGRYRTLEVSEADIDHLIATPLPQDAENIEVEREFDTWADAGYWITLILLPPLLLGFRRGLLAAVVLTLVPAPAFADFWDDLWQRKDQQAHKAFIEGEPERAVALFEDDERWQAAARYRSEDYAGAANAYDRAPAPDLTARYNLGNSLARMGRYQEAIDAYDAVLTALPQHEDAEFNKALVEKLLEQQQQAEEQDNNEQQNEGGSDAENSRDQNQDQSDSGDPSEQQDQDAQDQQQEAQNEPQESESSEQQEAEPSEMETASRDEQRDALEQWLRRVPDDPGGLLRRKFQYETNQRLRQGDYRDRQTEKIW